MKYRLFDGTRRVLSVPFFLVVLACTLFPVVHAVAAPVRVAILPFDIHAGEPLGYLQTGIQDMLASRLAWKDRVVVIDKAEINPVAAGLSDHTGESLALLAGGKLQADLIITGSLTLIGQSASIDARVLDITGKRPPLPFFAQTNSLGGVIPHINQFATQINEKLFNRNMHSSAPSAAPADSQPSGFAGGTAAQPQAAGTPALSVSTQDGTPLANPHFRAGDHRSAASGFWKSRPLPYRINGMALGDVNRDGITETVMVTDDALKICQVSGRRLREISSIPLSSASQYLSVDVADINGNGVPEIFISSLVTDQRRLNAQVREFNGKGYPILTDNLPWYFRVTGTTDAEGVPTLLGQRQDRNEEGVSGSPIFKLIWQGDQYRRDRMMARSGRANVLGMALGDLRQSGEPALAGFDPADHLVVLGSDGRGPVWRSLESSGGSMSVYEMPVETPTDEPILTYYPLRAAIADLNRDGRLELISAHNHDAAKGVFNRFRNYSKGHLESRFWRDGTMVLDWKTAPLPGRISDIGISDIDGDGRRELVAATVTKEGTTVLSGAVSILTAYELMEP